MILDNPVNHPNFLNQLSLVNQVNLEGVGMEEGSWTDGAGKEGVGVVMNKEVKLNLDNWISHTIDLNQLSLDNRVKQEEVVMRRSTICLLQAKEEGAGVVLGNQVSLVMGKKVRVANLLNQLSLDNPVSLDNKVGQVSQEHDNRN